jgi:hypothetical protein
MELAVAGILADNETLIFSQLLPSTDTYLCINSPPVNASYYLQITALGYFASSTVVEWAELRQIEHSQDVRFQQQGETMNCKGKDY